MILLKEAEAIKSFLAKGKKQGKKVHFVPTMGALHQGHISLINSARSTDSIVVCSIFVNPTQFNEPIDFAKYPHTIENDILLLEQAGCDLLFLPSANEIYPDGLQNLDHYDIGYLETILEGKYRPGHFQGVCQVVHRLLAIVEPQKLFLGQKDYQQCMVIKRLIELINIQMELVICPTIRENNGLAMSSRNMRLSDTEKEKASTIFATLSNIQQELKLENTVNLEEKYTHWLTTEGFKVDYVAIKNADNLMPVENPGDRISLVALVAVFLNDVRLIDNLIISI